MGRAPRGALFGIRELRRVRPGLCRWGMLALCAALGSLSNTAFGQADAGKIPSSQELAGRVHWINTSVGISETYTDNVFLAPPGAQIADWVTQITPAISVVSSGPRLRLDAIYDPEIVEYANTNRAEGVFQRGNAIGNLELVDDLFFIEAGAKINQYDISLLGALTTSNVNITANRATASNSYISPYLTSNLGSFARADARFTYSRWRSNEVAPTLPDNDAGSVDLRLTSGPAHKLLTWKVAYWLESIRYVTNQETRSEVFTTDVKRLMTPTLGLVAQAGYESYDTGIAFPPLEGPRWRLGFEWTPSPRTLLAATAGKRLDDNAYSFEFHHRTRLTAWNASYSEDVTTTRSQFFVPETGNTAGILDQMFINQYPDPAQRQKAVQEFIARTGLPPSLGGPINFFSDQLFLQKRWLLSIGMIGSRNSLIANAFWQFRKALTTGPSAVSGDFGISDSIRMTGGNLAWSLRVTTRDTLTVEAGYTRNEFLDIDQIDDFAYYRAGLIRKLQPRLSASLFYRRQERTSTQPLSDYVENAGVVALRMTF